MGLETVYVRHKFSAFKTDEKGFERIIKYYGDVKRISLFEYKCIIAARRVIEFALLPIWLVLFIFHRLFETFSDWYEDIINI